jgi:hypothetical protein
MFSIAGSFLRTSAALPADKNRVDLSVDIQSRLAELN